MWSYFESGEGGGADYGLVTKRAVGGGGGGGGGGGAKNSFFP